MWSAICRWAATAWSSRASGNTTAMIGSSSATAAASIGPLSSVTATGSNRVIVTAEVKTEDKKYLAIRKGGAA